MKKEKIFNPESSVQNVVFSLVKCVCVVVAISKEPFCSLSCSFLCDAAVVMETDLGVALLSSVRDSLIWRVTAGHCQHRAFIKHCATMHIVQSSGGSLRLEFTLKT